ncbi:hypothetical protein [Halarcobacter anaerophilus]|uniref:hypothetical protein n=1 Tax=Halarcobacter anaerophilus TaxID=877500 RepID=UPI0005CACFD1|nr:hypothetical protein [Halarcobacter anaerophilus]
MKDIKYILEPALEDKKSLDELIYNDLECDIDFKDILVKKPWGSEYLLYENEYCAIWILNIKYMQNTSMHCHVKKQTSLVCLDGEIMCGTLEKTNLLQPLEGLFFEKKIFHQTQAINEKGAFVLEIETPVNKFDLARINDTYGRQGKEYENKKCYEDVENLSLSFPNNTVKKIGNTKIEIVKINAIEELEKYGLNSIVSILDKDEKMGKILRLKDLKEIKEGSIVLVLSQE